MKTKTLLLPFLACLASLIFAACDSSNGATGEAGSAPQKLSGRELFYSDSLNAYSYAKPYPVPTTAGTPAPKGYKPVYISSYARHGARRLHSLRFTESVLLLLRNADSLGCLTPLGKDVLSKVIVIDGDMRTSAAELELTGKGMEQHRGIAERMFRNYPNVFSHKGTEVRLYSTVSQRTMMSMFACDERLSELGPKIRCTRQASKALRYLQRVPEHPAKLSDREVETNFIREYFDVRPSVEKIFTENAPALKDSILFVSYLYQCASIALSLDFDDIDFMWDVFTFEELFTLQQASNYYSYLDNSNSPEYGDIVLPTIGPLVKDFVDKAEAALQQEVPGADLRFGHDSFLVSLYALLGVDGIVAREENPLKVIDIFQIFKAAPMAGNFQMVFFRNRSGDVLVKILQNEVESSLPVETDIYPYYHWDDVRTYFLSILARCGISCETFI